MSIINKYQYNDAIEILNNKIKEKRTCIEQKLKKTNTNEEQQTVKNIPQLKKPKKN